MCACLCACPCTCALVQPYTYKHLQTTCICVVFDFCFWMSKQLMFLVSFIQCAKHKCLALFVRRLSIAHASGCIDSATAHFCCTSGHRVRSAKISLTYKHADIYAHRNTRRHTQIQTYLQTLRHTNMQTCWYTNISVADLENEHTPFL